MPTSLQSQTKLYIANCVLGCLPVLTDTSKDKLRTKLQRLKRAELLALYRVLK